MQDTVASTHYDDRARRVALAVQQATGIEHILLFGSRARGDYDSDSDIDLLVVHPDDPAMATTCRQAAAQAVQNLLPRICQYGCDISLTCTLCHDATWPQSCCSQGRQGWSYPHGLYLSPSFRESSPPGSPRLEAMECAFHAVLQFNALSGYMREGEVSFPGCLPHGCG